MVRNPNTAGAGNYFHNVFNECLDVIDYEDLNLSDWSVSILNQNPTFRKNNYPILGIGDSDAIREYGRTVLYYHSKGESYDMIFDLDHPGSFWAKSIIRNTVLDSILG